MRHKRGSGMLILTIIALACTHIATAALAYDFGHAAACKTINKQLEMSKIEQKG